MLERILEPEVMDSDAEASDYDAMDHSQVNTLFVDDLLAFGDIGTDILDLGTGTARIPIELCQRNDSCRILAIDMAGSMLQLAKLNIEIAALIERIFVQQVDAKAMPFEEDQFDTTMSNSIIHHIPSPLAALSEAVRVTRPGGMLFFRDLMRPATQTELESLVTQYAGEESDHAQKMFAESLAAALDLDEIRDMVQGFGFSRDTVQATSDRHWTWAARKPA